MGHWMRGALATLALTAAFMTTPGWAAERELRITLQLPISSHIGQNLLMFEQEVEANSNGAIDVQIYDSAQLFKDDEVIGAVAAGEVEMGTVPLTRFAAAVPAVDIFYMPFLFNTEPLVDAATARDGPVRGPLDAEILDRTGTRPLWWQSFGGAVMLSKGAPLKEPGEIAGKRVRVFGPTLAKYVEMLDGDPLLISGSDQYAAYRDGSVDVGMTGVSSVQTRSLWDVMDAITLTGHATIEFVVLINEDVWDGLADAHKAILQAAAENAEMAVRTGFRQAERDAVEAARSRGMTVYQPTPQEIEAWRKSAQPVYDDYRNTAGALGADMQQAARSLRRKFPQP